MSERTMTTRPPFKKTGEGVWAASGGLVVAGPDEVAFLKENVRGVERRRARICAHADDQELLQDMLILLERGTYVRPHLHRDKAESLCVIEGEADAVFFDDAGAITEAITIGPAHTGRQFFYRISSPRFHTLLLRSDHFIFHETTTGPFRREFTQAAPWAPEEGDPAAGDYLSSLEGQVRAFIRNGVE